MSLEFPKSLRRVMLGGLVAILWVLLACSVPSSGDAPQEEAVTIEGPPVVNISSPLPNATYMEGTNVNIMARIENAGPDVSRVEVRLNDAIVGQVDAPNQSGAAAFTITQGWPATIAGEYQVSIVAFRADGSSSSPATVSVEVIGARVEPTATPTEAATEVPDESDESDEAPEEAQSLPTVPPLEQQPTNTPQPAEPTAVPPTNTPSSPMARMIEGVNVRSGPATSFPTVGSFAAGTETELLAVNRAGDWYKIRYYNSEGWVFKNLVSASGNVASLPVEADAPTPAPTAVPPAGGDGGGGNSNSTVNLEIVNVQVSPHPLTCDRASEVQVTVRNTGTTDAPSGGMIAVVVIRSSDGQELARTETAFPKLAAGQQSTSGANISSDTFVGEAQRVVVTIDRDNAVAESNENDNSRNNPNDDFVLRRGSCP